MSRTNLQKQSPSCAPEVLRLPDLIQTIGPCTMHVWISWRTGQLGILHLSWILRKVINLLMLAWSGVTDSGNQNKHPHGRRKLGKTRDWTLAPAWWTIPGQRWRWHGSGENGRNMGYMGTSHSNFLLCYAPPPSLTSAWLSFSKLSGGFQESFENHWDGLNL